MSDKINDGGSAFPTSLNGKWAGSGSNAVFAPDMTDGMSLRDWFAGMALQGISRDWGCTPEQRAAEAYSYADAMLKARAKHGAD